MWTHRTSRIFVGHALFAMTRVSGGPIASKSSAFALLHAGSGTETLCAQLPRHIGPGDGYSTNVFLFLWPPVHFWTSARGTLLLRLPLFDITLQPNSLVMVM